LKRPRLCLVARGRYRLSVRAHREHALAGRCHVGATGEGMAATLLPWLIAHQYTGRARADVAAAGGGDVLALAVIHSWR
jgi:hypothetical protein